MASNKTKIKFAFYKVELKQNFYPDFMSILKELEKNTENLTQKVNGNLYIKLSSKEDLNGGMYSAVFAKLRMSGLPMRTNIETGSSSSLNLEESEGLSECSAIAYSSRCNVIAIQQNKNAMSPVAICNYIKDIVNNSDFEFIPIYRTDTYEKFLKLETISSFEYRLVGMKDLSWLNEYDLSTEDKLRFQAFEKDPYVEIKITKGKEKNGSLLGRLQKMIYALIDHSSSKEGEASIQKLIVKGKYCEDDNKTEILNFLLDRLIYECELSM